MQIQSITSGDHAYAAPRVAKQLSMFAAGAPAFDSAFEGAEHQALDESSWVEHVPGWLAGSDALFDTLASSMRWRADRRLMYERTVDVPRLTAWPPEDGDVPAVVRGMSMALSVRYGEPLASIGLALYRGGADSVAMHGDRLGARVGNAAVAIVSLGARRRFTLKPREGGGSLGFDLGEGDLFVMGGACQRDWLHGVPKVASAGQRMSIQFRPSGVARPRYRLHHSYRSDRPSQSPSPSLPQRAGQRA